MGIVLAGSPTDGKDWEATRPDGHHVGRRAIQQWCASVVTSSPNIKRFRRTWRLRDVPYLNWRPGIWGGSRCIAAWAVPPQHYPFGVVAYFPGLLVVRASFNQNSMESPTHCLGPQTNDGRAPPSVKANSAMTGRPVQGHRCSIRPSYMS